MKGAVEPFDEKGMGGMFRTPISMEEPMYRVARNLARLCSAALLTAGMACGAGQNAPQAPERPAEAAETQAEATPTTETPGPAPGEEAEAHGNGGQASDAGHAHGQEQAGQNDQGGEARAAELAAYEKARPVFEKYCAACHTKGGKKADAEALEHFDMTSYPFGGHHAHEMAEEIREVLGATGKKATMPEGRPGAVKGQELQLILDWAKAYEDAHAGTQGGHHH
jgi:hypothetical protein